MIRILAIISTNNNINFMDRRIKKFMSFAGKKSLLTEKIS